MSGGENLDDIDKIVKDNKVNQDEAKQLHDFISSGNTNSVDAKGFSDKLNLTPDLIGKMLLGIEDNINADMESTNVPVFVGLLNALNTYIDKIYQGNNPVLKNDLLKKINNLKDAFNNIDALKTRSELANNVKEKHQALAESSSQILVAEVIRQFADTDIAKTEAASRISEIFKTPVSDVGSFLGVQKTVYQANQLDFQKSVKDLSNFDKKNPSIKMLLNNNNEAQSGSVEGLRTHINTRLDKVNSEGLFTNLKGIKGNAFNDFMDKQKAILASLPSEQVIGYVNKLKTKVADLQKNPNLNEVEKKNMETLFNGILNDVDSYIVSNNVEVPQIDKKDYLGKISHDGLFENPGYKKAFNACFDEAKTGKPDPRFEGFIDQYISSEYEATGGKKLTFEKKYVVAGVDSDNGDQEISTYSRGTRVVVITPQIDGADYQIEGKTNKSYVTFGKNENVDKSKYDRFESMYQNIDGKDMLNGQEFNVDLTVGSDLNQFDQWGVGSFSLRLGKQGNDVFNSNPGLGKIFNSIDGYKNKLNNSNTEEYKKGFFDAVVNEVINRAPTNNILFQQYVNLISSEQGLNLSYLGKDEAQQKANYQLLSNFIKTNKWLENGDDAQKKLATTIGSIGLVFKSKEAPKGLQETVKQYAEVLFKSPVGKMILGLVDSFFGGKGVFFKWIEKFDKGDKLHDIIDKQFKENYGLSNDQLGVIGDIYKDNTFNNDSKQEFKVDSFEGAASNKGINKLVDMLKDKGDLLDINVFQRFVKGGELVLMDGKEEKKVKISDVFVINKEGKYSLKKDISEEALKLIMKQDVIKDAVIKTDALLKAQNGKDGKPDYGNSEKTKKGIQTEADYAVFMSAYLMGGSKGQGKFHYVISENYNNFFGGSMPDKPAGDQNTGAASNKGISDADISVDNTEKGKYKYSFKYGDKDLTFDSDKDLTVEEQKQKANEKIKDHENGINKTWFEDFFKKPANGKYDGEYYKKMKSGLADIFLNDFSSKIAGNEKGRYNYLADNLMAKLNTKKESFAKFLKEDDRFNQSKTSDLLKMLDKSVIKATNFVKDKDGEIALSDGKKGIKLSHGMKDFLIKEKVGSDQTAGVSDQVKSADKNPEIDVQNKDVIDANVKNSLKVDKKIDIKEEKQIIESAQNKLKIICEKQKLIDEGLSTIKGTIQQDKASGELYIYNNGSRTKLPANIENLMNVKKTYEDQFIDMFVKSGEIRWIRSDGTTQNDVMFQPKMFLNVGLKDVGYDYSRIKLSIIEREQDGTRSDYYGIHPNRKIKSAEIGGKNILEKDKTNPPKQLDLKQSNKNEINIDNQNAKFDISKLSFYQLLANGIIKELDFNSPEYNKTIEGYEPTEGSSGENLVEGKYYVIDFETDLDGRKKLNDKLDKLPGRNLETGIITYMTNGESGLALLKKRKEIKQA